MTSPEALPKTTFLVDMDVSYYRKPDSLTKKVNSLLTIERDATGKVVRHTEEVSFIIQPGDLHFGID